MKKYLIFTPLALDFYIWYLIMGLTNNLNKLIDPPTSTIIGWTITGIWTLLSTVLYFVGLWKMAVSKDFDAHLAAGISLYVKLPQIVPNLILLAIGLTMLIWPMGIFISAGIWGIMAFTFGATSIVVALACFRAWREGFISIMKAILYGVMAFIPVIEYVVPILLLIKTKNRKQIE